jgi:hypothetical protein
LTVALIFGEAQERADVYVTLLDGPARPRRPVSFCMSPPEANDMMVLISRPTRSENHVMTSYVAPRKAWPD